MYLVLPSGVLVLYTFYHSYVQLLSIDLIALKQCSGSNVLISFCQQLQSSNPAVTCCQTVPATSDVFTLFIIHCVHILCHLKKIDASSYVTHHPSVCLANYIQNTSDHDHDPEWIFLGFWGWIGVQFMPQDQIILKNVCNGNKIWFSWMLQKPSVVVNLKVQCHDLVFHLHIFAFSLYIKHYSPVHLTSFG